MAINLTDKLYANTGSQVIADAIQIASGYMAITSAQRNALTTAQKQQGTLVFETDNKKTYRYIDGEWEEIIDPDLSNYYDKQIADNKFVTKDTLINLVLNCGSSTEVVY